MNEIIKHLQSHASVRAFTDKQISNEQEKTIIKTAQHSSTSSNRQAYSIVGIRDRKKKEILYELTGNQQHVLDSSLFLVFCADLHRLDKINLAKGYETHSDYTEMFLIATVDASLVAERALIAAEALGLGGVMVGGIRNKPDEVCKLLHLPQLVYPVMGMSLGYPLKEAKVKPRLPFEEIYHKEEYSEENSEKYIAVYDDAINEIGYLKGREVLTEKYPDFKGEYSWSEHTARRHAEIVRPHMKPFLESRGFLKK